MAEVARGGNVAGRLFDDGLCLPSGSSLQTIQQDYVIAAVEEARLGAPRQLTQAG